MASKKRNGGGKKGSSSVKRTNRSQAGTSKSTTKSTKKASTGTGFSVTGKSVEDLLKNGSAHLHQYKEENLRAIVTRLSSAGNKRLRRAESSGATDSPAYQAAQRSGGKFSAKGKDLEGLKSEFLRLKAYFEDPTSTQAQWNRIKKEATRQAQESGLIAHEVRSGVPEGWTLDEETGTYSNPDFGGGWFFDTDLGAFVDDASGDLVNTDGAERTYHDFDATQDNRRTEKGTETGDIWAMVDSLAELDTAFKKQVGGYSSDVLTLRQQLFVEIDNEYVNHPELTLEEVRDLVMGRLDEIKDANNKFYKEAANIGASRFM